LKEIFCTIGIAYLAIRLTSSISYVIGRIIWQRIPLRHRASVPQEDSDTVEASLGIDAACRPGRFHRR